MLVVANHACRLNPCVPYGKLITSVREAKGVSQRQLAKMAGLSTDRIWRAEKGEHSRKTLIAIAKALGHSIEEFDAMAAGTPQIVVSMPDGTGTKIPATVVRHAEQAARAANMTLGEWVSATLKSALTIPPASPPTDVWIESEKKRNHSR